MLLLLHQASVYNSGIMLERGRQMERERTATETQNERAAVLRCLQVYVLQPCSRSPHYTTL